jgi:hypothetical protein
MEDVDYCYSQGWNIATVNMGYDIISEPDIYHAMDRSLWDEYGDEAMSVLPLSTEVYTGCPLAASKYDINLITFGDNPRGDLHCQSGVLSGHQLIEIVSWQRPDKIILLGYDCTGTHWHGDYPSHMANAKNIETHAKAFDSLIHLPVINCSRNTVIESFPRVVLQDA